jgi:hypothetical protein
VWQLACSEKECIAKAIILPGTRVPTSKQYLTDCPVVGNYRTVKDSRQTNAGIYPGATRFGHLMLSSLGVKKPSVRLPWRYLVEIKSNGTTNTT